MRRSGGATVPRVHALLLVRDEADIISQTLEHLLSWAAGVYVLDTGSTDGTWELVRERAAREPGRVFVDRSAELFQSGLRSVLFARHRHRFGRGDWIARVDADEFYHVPPGEFVRDRVRAHEGRVAVWQYLFVLTREEARAWRRRGAARLEERAGAIEDRRRWFIRHPFPEVRLYRYRPSMRWPAGRADPANPGPMAAERIPVRHYRFRDPAQIRARVRLRARIAAETAMVGRHWEVGAVRECLVDECDAEVQRWEEGEELPGTVGWPDPEAHLRVTPTGRLGRMCHGMGMGWVLDVVAR